MEVNYPPPGKKVDQLLISADPLWDKMVSALEGTKIAITEDHFNQLAFTKEYRQHLISLVISALILNSNKPVEHYDLMSFDFIHPNKALMIELNSKELAKIKKEAHEFIKDYIAQQVVGANTFGNYNRNKPVAVACSLAEYVATIKCLEESISKEILKADVVKSLSNIFCSPNFYKPAKDATSTKYGDRKVIGNPLKNYVGDPFSDYLPYIEPPEKESIMKIIIKGD